MRFLTDTNIDFVSRRKFTGILSLVVVAAGLVSLAMHKGPKYSIDFTGGSLVQVQFVADVGVDDVRSALSRVNLAQAEIQQFGAPNEMLIRIQDRPGENEANNMRAVEAVMEALRDRWPDLTLRREETVGPKIGGELRSAAFQAIVLALVLILAYVSWRFEFRFAVAAIVALVHDVLITLGVFSIFDYEVSLAVIAAFLTIVGYSLNDTIVVFDRIRENLRVPARKAYPEVLNRSVNQSLSRTIITSSTTLLVVGILFFFGGEVLRDFSFALVIGVLVGTYSSVFVATPLLVEWEAHRPRRVK